MCQTSHKIPTLGLSIFHQYEVGTHSVHSSIQDMRAPLYLMDPSLLSCCRTNRGGRFVLRLDIGARIIAFLVFSSRSASYTRFATKTFVSHLYRGAKLDGLAGDSATTEFSPTINHHCIQSVDYRPPRFQNNDRDIEQRILGSCEDLDCSENSIVASIARGLDVSEQRVRKR